MVQRIISVSGAHIINSGKILFSRSSITGVLANSSNLLGVHVSGSQESSSYIMSCLIVLRLGHRVVKWWNV